MKYIKLNENWNADPNSPELIVKEVEDNLKLDFFLNYFVFNSFNEGDKGVLKFINCYQYIISNCNDEGYFMGQYRFKHKDLPFGEFYEIEGDYSFEGKKIIQHKTKNLRHFIFMLKENIIECEAESFTIEFIKN